jgi:hypothetical protein
MAASCANQVSGKSSRHDLRYAQAAYRVSNGNLQSDQLHLVKALNIICTTREKEIRAEFA